MVYLPTVPRIRLLSDAVINQIAAGEVVERPASVVKELVENALDAGARSIRIQLGAGGRELIEIGDDGCGMDRDDALLCIERHATSKLRTADELTSLVTLGFRGEALPSIAAVCRLTVETAERDGEGTLVEVEFGLIRDALPCARGRGTRIVARDLFGRLPARLKFLRSESTELRHAVQAIQALAFAHPSVGFTLGHGARQLLSLPPVADAGNRLADLFGSARARAAVAVHHNAGEATVRGFLLPPSPSRDIVLVVNGRVVRDRLLVSAVARALRGPSGASEADAWLALEIPADRVDVNVHPMKAEVRFAEPGRIVAAVTQAIAAARPGLHGVVPLRVVTVPGSPAGATEPDFHQLPLSSFQPWTPAATPRVAEAPPELAGWEPASTSPGAPTAGFGRFIGQYRSTYLLLEDEFGLLLVDQHVAHERVLFERILAAGETASTQRLLVPAVVDLPPAQALAAEGFAAELAAVGLELEPASGHAVRVLSLPPGVPPAEASRIVTGLLADLLDARQPGETLLERAAASMACQAAIKKNWPLGRAEAEALLRDLAAANDPHRCPHGRPIMLRLGHDEIERRIGRR